MGFIRVAYRLVVLSNTTVAASCQKSQESSSVPKTECPSSPNLWMESREVLESCWSSASIGISKQQALTPVKEHLCSRTDGLDSKNEDKQEKGKHSLFPCPLMWAGCHQKVWPGFRVGLSTSSHFIKRFLTGTPGGVKWTECTLHFMTGR